MIAGGFARPSNNNGPDAELELMSRAPLIASFLLVLAALFSTEFAHADTQAALARDLKVTQPETVGLSSERLKRLDAAMKRLVDSKEFAGVVTLAARHGKIVHFRSYGQQDLARAKPMPKDAIFRIYSMTKPITGVAMMMLYEEGRWHPDDPIAKFVPQFADLRVFAGLDPNGQPILEAPAHAPTMGELMTHTAGFTYGVFDDTWVDLQYEKQGVVSRQTLMFTTSSLQELIDKLARIPLLYQPGTRWEYSVSVDIQAYIVEKLSGKTMPEFLGERIFEPLGMRDTGYYVSKEKLARLATLYEVDTERKALKVREQPPDPGVPPAIAAGGYGLYMTAMDYLRFAQMLLNGGELGGVRVLAPRTVELMRSNHLPEKFKNAEFGGVARLIRPGVGFGYDFGVQMDPFQVGALSGAGTYTWGGAAGTWFWIDPQLDVVFVGMTQKWFDFRLVELARATFYQALVEPDR